MGLTTSLWPETDEQLVPAETWDVNGITGPRALVEYQHDPIGFLADVLSVPASSVVWSLNPGYTGHAWDGTPDPLEELAVALAEGKSAGAESGTGTGKTYLAAGLALWFLASWQGARVFAFATTEDQLRLYIFAEIGKHWPAFKRRFPTAEMTDLRIRMDASSPDRESWGMVGRAAAVRAGEEVSSKVAGMHAEHMLVITDETQGIPHAILEGIENTCTAPHNLRLALGNPNSQDDALHKACAAPGVVGVRISALDHPNVVTGNAGLIPGAVSRKSINERAAKYGETSTVYESRVRGISPAQATDALIRRDWLDAAAARYLDPRYRTGQRALGVDAANSENGDLAAIARGDGACLLEVEAFPCPDSNALGRDVFAEMTNPHAAVDARYVGVDSVGVGAGTVNELFRLTGEKGLPRVRGLNGGAKPVKRAERAPDGSPFDWAPDANAFDNLRSQMYWQFREDLRLGRIALPNDPELFRQAVQPRFKDDGGKTVIEKKDDLKRRTGGESPDRLDAVVYWNWVRPRAAVPVHVDIPDNVSRLRVVPGRGVVRVNEDGTVPKRNVAQPGRVRMPSVRMPRAGR